MLDLEKTIGSQYANSPSLLQLIQNMNGYIDPSSDIDNFYSFVMDLNSAQGFGLDIWGRIVVVGRVLQVASTTFLGFSGDTTTSGDSFDTAPFYNDSNVTSNYALTDDAYRVVIFAKALTNICDGSIKAINQVLINLTSALHALGFCPPGNCYCTDGLNMTMTYHFNIGASALPPLLQAIVSQTGILPRPAGVATSIVVS